MLRAEPPVAIGVPQEVDDLDQLVLGVVDARDVLERHPRLAGGVVPLGARAPEARQGARRAAARTARQPDEERHQEDDRPERQEDREQQRAPLVDRLGVHHDVVRHQQLQQLVVGERRADRLEVGIGRIRALRVGHLLLERALDLVALGGDLGDVAGRDLLAEERVGHVEPALAVRDQVDDEPVEGQEGEEDPPEPPAAGHPEAPARSAPFSAPPRPSSPDRPPRAPAQGAGGAPAWAAGRRPMPRLPVVVHAGNGGGVSSPGSSPISRRRSPRPRTRPPPRRRRRRGS